MSDFVIDHGLLGIPATGFSGGGIVRVALGDRTYDSDKLEWEMRGTDAIAVCNGLELQISADARSLTVALINNGKSDVRVRDVTIEFHPDRLRNAPAAEDYLEYIHSANFEMLSGVKRVGLPSRWLKANPAGSMVYVLHHRSTAEAWLFSTLPPHAGDFVTFRALHDEPHMEGHFGLEIKSVLECVVRPGKSISTSTIQFRRGEAMALLMELGATWQEGLKKTAKAPCVGWNSWDFFASAVSSKDVIENTRAARDLFGISRPDVVIDGGWEQRWGTWEANSSFPEGLEGVAAKISQEGGVPGIWIAPTAVNVYTRLYRDHEDWFVRDHQGKMLEQSFGYGPCAQLDVTHPDVQGWIHRLFVRLRDCGFRTFKVDFTQQLLEAGSFHDKSVPRGAVLRKLFEIIRGAIGPENYLFTCGAHYESVTGLADAVRTSGDIHNHWSHVLLNLTGISARWWMHGRLWNNDPDFLIVRTAENCPGAPLNRPMNLRPLDYGQLWRSGREFNQREAQTYALLVLLGGGDIMLSDDLPSLTSSGRDLIQRVLNNQLTRPAIPLDLFDSHEGLPSLWLADEPDHWLLGLFNWEEDPREFRVDLAKIGVMASGPMRSFWDDAPADFKNGIVEASVQPRACLGIRIAKKPS